MSPEANGSCPFTEQPEHVIASPVGNDPGVHTLLIEIHDLLIVEHEAFLVPVGSDNREAWHCLTEVGVDGRPGDWVQAPQLTGCGYIESLGVERDSHEVHK